MSTIETSIRTTISAPHQEGIRQQTAESEGLQRHFMRAHRRHHRDEVERSAEFPNSQTEGARLSLVDRLGALIDRLGDTLECLIDRLAKSTDPGAGAGEPDPAQGHCPCSSTTGTGTQTPGSTTGSGNSHTDPNPKGESFKEHLGKAYSGKDKLSEAELQNGIVSYQLSQVSAELEESYKDLFAQAIKSGNSISESVASSIKVLRTDGRLKAEDAQWLFSLSSRAAQLDDNKEYLRTTAGDEPHFQLANALQAAEVTLASIQNGTIKVSMLKL